jgi:hypothetical protein
MRLNQAVRKVLRDTQCYVTSTTVTPGAAKDYTLTSGVLDILDFSFTQSAYTSRLERLSVPDLLYLRSQGASASRPTHYAFAGNNNVMFYPTPGRPTRWRCTTCRRRRRCHRVARLVICDTHELRWHPRRL